HSIGTVGDAHRMRVAGIILVGALSVAVAGETAAQVRANAKGPISLQAKAMTASVPLPRVRPPEASPRPKSVPPVVQSAPPTPDKGPAEADEPSACLVALSAGLAEVQPLPPIV